jgi:hypothetical protein
MEETSVCTCYYYMNVLMQKNNRYCRKYHSLVNCELVPSGTSSSVIQGLFLACKNFRNLLLCFSTYRVRLFQGFCAIPEEFLLLFGSYV